jgi:hypothetical protein
MRLNAAGKAIEKALPVAIIKKDVPPIIPTNGNVIDSPFIFNS